MHNLTVAAVLLFLVLSLLFSRQLWQRYLHHFSRRCLQQLGYTYGELKYSFEEIIYMVSLPTPNPVLQQATVNNIHIEVEHGSLLYPTARALRVVFTDRHGVRQLLAYLSFDRFHVPILDEANALKKIKDSDLTKVSIFLFHHPKIHREIIEEVLRKLRG